jgi:hypothetical protein
MSNQITFRKMETRGAGWMQVEVETATQKFSFRFDLQDRGSQDSLVRMILGAQAPRDLTFPLLGDGVEVKENTDGMPDFAWTHSPTRG